MRGKHEEMTNNNQQQLSSLTSSDVTGCEDLSPEDLAKRMDSLASSIEDEDGQSLKGNGTESLEDYDFVNPKSGPRKTVHWGNKTIFQDLIVTNAVSPVNFSIQSYRLSGHLKGLEQNMTEWYGAYEKGKGRESPLEFKNIVLDGYYAVRYKGQGKDETERWVRCQIIKPFKESHPILVQLVDHGFYAQTEPFCLQPLRKVFCQLPIQSFPGKLHFLESSKAYFTPEDCHRFHKRVDGKAFCGIILSSAAAATSGANGDASPSTTDTRLSVILIDTSGDKDEYLHQDFVPKRH